MHYPETIPQRSCQHSRPGSGTHQGKPWQIQPDTPGRRPLPNNNIDDIILHRWIQHLLHLPVEPVDFVYKQNVSLLEIV